MQSKDHTSAAPFRRQQAACLCEPDEPPRASRGPERRAAWTGRRGEIVPHRGAERTPGRRLQPLGLLGLCPRPASSVESPPAPDRPAAWAAVPLVADITRARHLLVFLLHVRLRDASRRDGALDARAV